MVPEAFAWWKFPVSKLGYGAVPGCAGSLLPRVQYLVILLVVLPKTLLKKEDTLNLQLWL